MQIDLVQGMMDCLYAECKPLITECVMAELEKLGQKYRVALKVAKVLLLTLCLAHTYLSRLALRHVRHHQSHMHAQLIGTNNASLASAESLEDQAALSKQLSCTTQWSLLYHCDVPVWTTSELHLSGVSGIWFHALIIYAWESLSFSLGSIPVVSFVQDPRIEKLPCTHKGTYADDCICERVKQHKCYIVATCDRDLRRRIRKVGCLKISQGACWQVQFLQSWHA